MILKIVISLMAALSTVGAPVEASVSRSNVVDLKGRTPRRKCEVLLIERAPLGELIRFPISKPAYNTDTDFLKSSEHVYFYYTGTAANPFEHTRAKDWSVSYALPKSDSLYVVRGAPRTVNAVMIAKAGRMDLHEMKVHFEDISYSKLRTPPVFGLLQTLIDNVRQLESHVQNVPYENVNLDYRELLSESSIDRKAEAVVNSWTTKGDHEDRFKTLLKEWLYYRKPAGGNSADCRNLLEYLVPHLEKAYRGTAFSQEILFSSLEKFR